MTSFRRDEKGVSTVVGAVLVFALLVLTLVTVKTEFMPIWDEDREAEHMAMIADQIQLIKGDADRQTANGTSGAITDPLTLQMKEGFQMFRGNKQAGATASFTPSASGTGIQLSSPELFVQVQGSQPLFGLDESWQAVTTGNTVTNILSVEHLRLRVDMGPSYDENDSATLNVYDSDGAFAGKVTITFRDYPSEHALEIRTYNRNNLEVSKDVEAFFQQSLFDYLYFDALDGALLFNQIIAGAKAPLTMTMTQAGLVADYTLAYASLTSGGGIVGGGGLSVTNYADTVASGVLQVDARNGAYIDQKYTLEHGALFLEQPTGSVMIAPPQFFAAATTDTAFVRWSIPTLTGAETMIGGARSAAVTLQPFGAKSDIAASAARVTFVVPTGYPALWAEFLTDQLEAGGLTGGGAAPEFTVIQQTASVQVTIFGPTASPSDTTRDVALELHYAGIEVQLRPSG